MYKYIVAFTELVRFNCKILCLNMFGCRQIERAWVAFLGKNASIECANDSCIYLGTKFCLSCGSLIASRSKAKIIVGNNVFINRNCTIVSHDEIVIKDGVTIGPNCCIYDHDHDLLNRGRFKTARICIGENVWLGANVLVMKGVHIGDNSVIGAGCVVTHDVPANTILIQKRNNDYYPVHK